MSEAPAPAGFAGDLLALATTFCSDAERRRCRALLDLRGELLAAASASAEAAVCEARLAWWATELDKLVSARASHPAARAVYDTLDDAEATAEYLAEWRVEAGNRLRGERPDSAEQFAISNFRHYGALFAIMELAGGTGNLSAARDVGHACGTLAAITADDTEIQPAWLSATPPVGTAPDDLRRLLAQEAHAGLGRVSGAARLTQVMHALADKSLQRFASGSPAPGRFTLLWRAWRAALATGRGTTTAEDE